MQGEITSVMDRKVVAVDIDDTVDSVEHLLNSGIYSFVPVLDANRNPFGVISARDIVDFHTRHGKPKAVRAWEICSHRVIAVVPGTKLREAAQLMLAKHVHHLVVMDHGHVTGVVSTLDLLERFLQQEPACLPG